MENKITNRLSFSEMLKVSDWMRLNKETVSRITTDNLIKMVKECTNVTVNATNLKTICKEVNVFPKRSRRDSSAGKVRARRNDSVFARGILEIAEALDVELSVDEDLRAIASPPSLNGVHGSKE